MTMLWSNCQMVQVAPTTIMATEDGTDDLATVPSDYAEAGIAEEKCEDGFKAVGRRESDAITPFPKSKNGVVILGLHYVDRERRCHEKFPGRFAKSSRHRLTGEGSLFDEKKMLMRRAGNCGSGNEKSRSSPVGVAQSPIKHVCGTTHSYQAMESKASTRQRIGQ
jgi:hypothetical protein